MHTHRVSRFRRRSLVVVSLCVWGFGAVGASPHQSPGSCNGNGVTLNISRTPASVVVGGTVGYNVSIDNQDDASIALVACDAEDVDVVFYCPGADGTPDLTMPIVITTTPRPPRGHAAHGHRRHADVYAQRQRRSHRCGGAGDRR